MRRRRSLGRVLQDSFRGATTRTAERCDNTSASNGPLSNAASGGGATDEQSCRAGRRGSVGSSTLGAGLFGQSAVSAGSSRVRPRRDSMKTSIFASRKNRTASSSEITTEEEGGEMLRQIAQLRQHFVASIDAAVGPLTDKLDDAVDELAGLKKTLARFEIGQAKTNRLLDSLLVSSGGDRWMPIAASNVGSQQRASLEGRRSSSFSRRRNTCTSEYERPAPANAAEAPGAGEPQQRRASTRGAL